MKSKIVEAIGLPTHAVALIWSDAAPADAISLKPGRWACLMSLFAATAAKGRVCSINRETYGCWGGGTGMGFGNCYEKFPGGVQCFYRFLSDGNEKSEHGREVAKQVAAWGDHHWTDEFLKGERYLKDSDAVERFLMASPMREIPAKCVVLKPLEMVDERDDVKNITFFVDPDRLSALVVLAKYTEPDEDNVIMSWAAGCQSVGIFAYEELRRESPRAVVGLTDLSARATVRPLLGKDVMSFTAPWPRFLQMEENVDDSFLQRPTWHGLREH